MLARILAWPNDIPSQILMFIEINDGIYNFQAGKTCRMLNTYSGWLDHILQHDKHVLIGAGDPRGQPAAGCVVVEFGLVGA